MCGIAGFLDPGARATSGALHETARHMAAALVHRGPDDEGTWAEPEVQLGLGHRRLAVIDLTAEGRQPMVSADGRWVLTFNGEIYDHPRIRREEEGHGHRFRGTSDTEVLLAAIARRGLRQALTDADGMFALAAYDRRERRLHLARDRFGEKPLFYGECGGAVVFGSELSALRRHPSFDAAIDRDALSTYLRFKYVPAPRSIHRCVRKLLPGTIVEVAATTGRVGTPSPFWSAPVAIEAARSRPFTGSFEEAVRELRGLIGTSVRDRLVADVPVGAFLSGGVDSTVVVAAARAVSAAPVRTFTVGYEDQAWDEARRAAELAAQLGTDHHELRVTPADVLEIVPQLPSMYDEPFGDSSQLPTHLIARFARGEVTVALSGDGGDEVFGGYNRHVWAPGVWRRMERLPAGARARFGRWAGSVDEGTWDRLAGGAGRAVPALRHRLPGQKVHKLARAMTSPDASAFYRDLLSHWREPDRLVPGGREFVPFAWPTGVGFREAAMQLDLTGYLPDDILQKVDRATMAVSLETRVPFLTPPIVEFAWRLPRAFLVDGSVGKRILRGVLRDLLPNAAEPGPKMGFGVPIGDWLRSELHGWADGLFDGASAFDDGLIDRDVARRVWRDHLGGANRQYELWTLLMFLAWYEER
jgi:asparagine synthase (glutamine-hydrolysing)